MGKTYRLGRANRLINLLFRALTRLGLGASYRRILTVPGRKSGRLYSTPVDVIEHGSSRYLVAGYGPAGWVRNARAAGEVTLTRGRRTARFGVVEASPEEAIPVLRKYIADIRVTRVVFDEVVAVEGAAATSQVREAFVARFGADRVVEIPPMSASEDFGSYGTGWQTPAVFWSVGGTDPDAYRKAEQTGTLNELATNHNPHFAPVLHPTLETGIQTLITGACAWLAAKNSVALG